MPEAEQVTCDGKLYFKSAVGLFEGGVNDGGLPSGCP